MQPVTRERSTCSPTPAAAAHGRSCTRHQQPCDGNVFRNRVTLTFDLFTSGSMRAERLLQSICVTILVLIARAVFLLERGHTDRQTDTNEHPTHAGGYNDDMGNYFTANGSINNVIENSRLSLPCAIQRCTIKPEVHNLLHRRQRRNEPGPQMTSTENFVKFRHVIFDTS